VPELPPAPETLAEKIANARPAIEGERKQITVLFVDVVGSMELTRALGAERWGVVLDRFLAIASAAIHDFEGTVSHFTGDGLMAVFGAPVAHEDHARRACLAVLQLQRGLRPLARELADADGVDIAIRCGLNSGEVVVGKIAEDLRMEFVPLGNTTNLAKRLESLAPPGSTVISTATAALVEGEFELAELAQHEIKGVPEPQPVFELLGRGPARTRLEAAEARGLSRFVGREREMAMLEQARETALAGDGQVVGIVGEAGVGKSRLCYEFEVRCRARGMPVYHVAGQAHAKSVPLASVLQLLRDFFAIGEDDPDRLARQRIEETISALDPGLSEELPLLFEFLSVSDPERPAERMDPEARQRRLLALLRRLARAQSAQQPELIVFEDLHWLDSASEAYLANHVEALQGTRSMLLVDFRPGYQAAWMSRSHYRELALSPLGAEASERLLADLLGSDPSLDGLAELIGERGEGNPLFIEEIVQSLVAQGSLLGERGAYRLVGTIEQVAVPPSVQAVLAARIDRLDEREKSVLGAAAVIGREFVQPTLERLTGLAAGELEEALGELASAGFVYLRELTPEPLYLFKHALAQEVAYGSQLEERRRALHAKAAEAIASVKPERLDERAALVAGHWEAAGEQLEAARWHARAAAWAGTGDPAAAFSHWQRVRELSDQLPESEEKATLGLSSRTFLLNLGWRLGIGREEAERLFGEGERIAAKAEDIRSRALLLGTYALTKAVSQGRLGEAAQLARQAVALAEESGDPALEVALATGACHCLALVGRLRESIAMADRAIALAGGDPSVGAGPLVGCPLAFSHAYRGLDLANLGELEEAGREIARGREIAGELGDAEVVGFTHLFACRHACLLGEAESTLGHARRAVEIAERIGDSFARSRAWMYLGMAQVMRERWQPALEALERSREICREQRTAVEVEPSRLALLAEAHLGLGEAERAREAAGEGVAIARAQENPQSGLIASLAQARVLLGTDGADARTEIEAALAHALELIRRTDMRAYEPHVHVTLAELARQSDDGRAWREELSEAQRLFTEIGASGYAERVAGELAVVTS
jgi:class 3 adenylate cyclase/tetratricopeptide (TPR) repeat protein